MRRRFGIGRAIAASISVVVMGALVPTFSFAQNTAAGTLSPMATSPVYESAFDGYQPFQDSEVKSWLEANEEIAKTDYMGGMAGTGQVKGVGVVSTQPKSASAAPGKRENGSDTAKVSKAEDKQRMEKMDNVPSPVKPANAPTNSQPLQPSPAK